MGVTVREKDPGSGVYWVFIRHRGQRRSRRIGDKRAAKFVKAKAEARIAEGHDPFVERAPVPLFTGYSQRWLDETIAPHKKRRTHEYYEQILTTHLRPAFGTMALDAIRPTHVRAFIAKKLAEGAARNTVKNMAATLRTILYTAQEDELIASNPAARVGRRSFNVRHDPQVDPATVLEPEQVAQVLAAAGKWHSDFEPLVSLLFYTGMREGEAFGIQWIDLDPARNLIYLRRTVSIRGKDAAAGESSLIVNTLKSGKGRTVDVPAALMARLQERRSIAQAEAAVAGREVSLWVFPSATDPARPLNASWFWRHVWTPLLDRAKVRAIRVHDARHTYASIMIRRGKPLAYVSRQLGHHSIKITVDLYAHFQEGGDRHHVEDLAQAIEAERSGAETRVLAEPEGDPAPDGTPGAPRRPRRERREPVSD